METVGGSIQLMFFIYALAAAISLATAWIIKLIFFAIRIQKKRSAVPTDTPAKGTT